MSNASVQGSAQDVPRLERLRVRNYRVLRDVTFADLTPMAVFIGPNGSGKSTLFDVLSFLSECINDDLRRAWDRRGRFDDLRSRGTGGPVVLELDFRAKDDLTLTYYLIIEENNDQPIIRKEILGLKGTYRVNIGKKEIQVDTVGDLWFDFSSGLGTVYNTNSRYNSDIVVKNFQSTEVFALNVFGLLDPEGEVASLRRYLANCQLSCIDSHRIRNAREAGSPQHLSSNGDNLVAVVHYLRQKHPDVLDHIYSVFRRRVPRASTVETRVLADDRLLLLLKDAPFDQPIPARFVSDGTLKLLAYLVLLHDPDPPSLIGIEEPENFLHPKLLYELAEECAVAADSAQVFVSTHSPYFLGPLPPDWVWVMYRGEDGFARAKRTADMRGIREFMAEGAHLGDLWMEGHFDVGDPRQF